MRKRGRPPHPDVLTPRQWEVLNLIRSGLSDRDIANRLGVSLSGAKYHVSEILGRLGVASREDAAKFSEDEPRATSRFGRRFMQMTIAAGVLTSAAAVAGLAVLGWGVAATSDDLSTDSEAGLEDVSLEEAIEVAQRRFDRQVEAGEMTFITSERTTWHEWYDDLFRRTREELMGGGRPSRPVAAYTPEYPCDPEVSSNPSCEDREAWELTFHGYTYLLGNDPTSLSYDAGGCREVQLVVAADRAEILGGTSQVLDPPFPDGCAVVPPKPQGWP